jgi:hypothetical protein
MSKTTRARHTSAYFKNRPGESLLRWYVRYEEFLNKFLHHVYLIGIFHMFSMEAELSEENKS